MYSRYVHRIGIKNWLNWENSLIKTFFLKSVKTMLVLLIVQYYGQELPTDYYLD